MTPTFPTTEAPPVMSWVGNGQSSAVLYANAKPVAKVVYDPSSDRWAWATYGTPGKVGTAVTEFEARKWARAAAKA